MRKGDQGSAISWDNCGVVPRPKKAKRKSASKHQQDENTFSPGISGTNGKTTTGFLAERASPEGGNVKPEPTDAEVRDILVHAMADVGADPALVYAFQKTGVYVCDENEKTLPKEKLKAFDGAVDEYLAALKRPPQ
jgi:hypothetical protein